MSGPPGVLATRLVRSWVYLYTAGLPADARLARRDEIESDLWEQLSDASRGADRRDEAAWEAFGRCVRGIPADLFWRLEQVGAGKRSGRVTRSRNRRGTVSAATAHKGFIAIAAMMAALSLAVAVSNSLAADDNWVIENMGRTPSIILMLIPAVIILAGLAAGLRSPSVGRILVFVGAAAVAVLWLWTIVVPALALLLIWCGLAMTAEPRKVTTASG